jgi:hypothetical protein
MALYVFKKDSPGKSACAGECVAKWPLYYREKVDAGGAVKESDFATITREDGKKQTTYKGMPLYFFAGDKAPGDTNGHGVRDVWSSPGPDGGAAAIERRARPTSVMSVPSAIPAMRKAGKVTSAVMARAPRAPGTPVPQHAVDAEPATRRPRRTPPTRPRAASGVASSPGKFAMRMARPSTKSANPGPRLLRG